jgi:hypothetical protein
MPFYPMRQSANQQQGIKGPLNRRKGRYMLDIERIFTLFVIFTSKGFDDLSTPQVVFNLRYFYQ